MAIAALIDAIERDAGKTDDHSQAKLARNLFLLRSQTASLQANVKAATRGGGEVVIIPPPSTGELHGPDLDVAWDKFLADPATKPSGQSVEEQMAIAERLGIVRELTAKGLFGAPDHPVDGADYSDYDAATNGGSDGPDGSGSYKIWINGELVATGQLKAGEDLTEVALANGLDLSD